ncbi:lipocalin-like domain-containing protein [Ichthyenterobacterium magnum]|nr:lipocalin family protein [Ichthyenterobacterium magnum]
MSKNLLSLLMLITFSFATSCSDDDVVETINETFIIGEWKLASITENDTDVSLNDCELLKSLNFNTSNEVIIKTYAFDSNNNCELDSDVTHSYTIDHSSITINGIMNAEISTPRNETLILKSVENSNYITKTYTRQ